MSWNNVNMPTIVEDGVDRTAAVFNNDEALADLQDSKIEQVTGDLASIINPYIFSSWSQC